MLHAEFQNKLENPITCKITKITNNKLRNKNYCLNFFNSKCKILKTIIRNSAKTVLQHNTSL